MVISSLSSSFAFFRELSQIMFAFFGIFLTTYVPSLHFLCSKLHVFLTTYPPLSANVICESSLRKYSIFFRCQHKITGWQITGPMQAFPCLQILVGKTLNALMLFDVRQVSVIVNCDTSNFMFECTFYV